MFDLTIASNTYKECFFQKRRESLYIMSMCHGPVCKVDYPLDNLAENEIAVKSYSENTGLYEALLELGFISGYKSKFPVGSGFVYICEVLNIEY